MLSPASDPSRPMHSFPRSAVDGPFALGDDRAYRTWRAAKLTAYPATPADLTVAVRDPRALSASEHAALADRCRRFNMAIYAGPPSGADAELPDALGRQFGLTQMDRNWLADETGISSITVRDRAGGGDYIPYTDRPIRWHTDGYYNPPERRIRAMILHCVASAASGGETRLLDHEIAYLLLRDADPRFIAALMRPDAMTIPAREDERGIARPAESGPVFSVDPDDGALHMRYTARTRSIAWSDDPSVRAAAAFLARLLAEPSPYLFRLTLQPGMGLLCNNVLHDRGGFSNDPARPRLIYRIRYHDRLQLDAG